MSMELTAIMPGVQDLNRSKSFLRGRTGLPPHGGAPTRLSPSLARPGAWVVFVRTTFGLANDIYQALRARGPTH
jgi:hypothetical protein